LRGINGREEEERWIVVVAVELTEAAGAGLTWADREWHRFPIWKFFPITLSIVMGTL